MEHNKWLACGNCVWLKGELCYLTRDLIEKYAYDKCIDWACKICGNGFRFHIDNQSCPVVDEVGKS